VSGGSSEVVWPVVVGGWGMDAQQRDRGGDCQQWLCSFLFVIPGPLSPESVLLGAMPVDF